MGAFSNEIYQVADHHARFDHRAYGTAGGQVDCSHLVAEIIKQATGINFSYIVANEYPHSPHFQKVDHPDRGDIVFWHKVPHGHVGVVIDTHSHRFVGAQSHGVGTDHYNSSYWRSHGSGPMFLRFIG